MKNFLIAFIVFLLWSVFAIWLYSIFSVTQSANSEIATSSLVIENPKTASPLTKNVEEILAQREIDTTTSPFEDFEEFTEDKKLRIVDELDETLFSYDQAIEVRANSAVVEIPDASRDFKYKISNYLKEHPEKEVHIISPYHPSEKIEIPNLGTKRGMVLKKMLLENDANASQIFIKPIIDTAPLEDDGTMFKTIGFQFKKLDPSRVVSEIKLLPENRIVYPRYDADKLLINNSLKEALAEIEEFFKRYPQATIDVIGHTDNIGDSGDNYRRGLTNSRQIKWYLTNKGNIPRAKINAISKGERSPIRSNRTPNGRTANKRIEIIYKINE